jgi:hypothetical protein
MPGVATYEQLAAKSIEANFGAFTCRMIDLDTLIATKKMAGRPKDLLHLKQLEAVRRKKNEQAGTPPPAPPSAREEPI